MPFKPAPRLETFHYVGLHRYFLTICCYRRQATFIEDRTVVPLIEQFRRTTRQFRFAVPAYCFMPDHFHALMEGCDDSADFRECIRQFKQRSAFTWKQRTGTALWQRGYYERVLRTEEDSFAVARYILANPVRGGLVHVPEDFPYSGSFTMELRDLRGSL